MYAILKTREYQTLSEDIDFLYDINSTNNHRSKNKLAKVTDAVEIRNEHGLRDGFEYLPSGTSNKEVGFTVDIVDVLPFIENAKGAVLSLMVNILDYIGLFICSHLFLC